MNFLENIEHHKTDYSKTEWKVYQYVIKHIERLETFTITKIAELSHTSTSAVLRFCQTLGYKGFKDFRYAAIDYLHHYYKRDSIDILDQMTDNYSSLINQLRNLNRNEIKKLTQAILTQDRLHILGIFLSSLPAKYLHMGLQDIGIASYFADDLNSGAHLTNIINEADTLIMFSINGSISNYKKLLSSLQNNMPKNSYLITLNEKATSSRYFNNTIVLPGSIFSQQSIVDTQSIAIIFVEILLNLIHDELG